MPTTTSPLTPATHGLRVAASFNLVLCGFVMKSQLDFHGWIYPRFCSRSRLGRTSRQSSPICSIAPQYPTSGLGHKIGKVTNPPHGLGPAPEGEFADRRLDEPIEPEGPCRPVGVTAAKRARAEAHRRSNQVDGLHQRPDV